MICCARNGLRQNRGGRSVIEMRRSQLSFGDGLIAEEVSDLREGWMKHADEVLADEDIEMAVYVCKVCSTHRGKRNEGESEVGQWKQLITNGHSPTRGTGSNPGAHRPDGLRIRCT
jgi:hypothetical protein